MSILLNNFLFLKGDFSMKNVKTVVLSLCAASLLTTFSLAQADEFIADAASGAGAAVQKTATDFNVNSNLRSSDEGANGASGMIAVVDGSDTTISVLAASKGIPDPCKLKRNCKHGTPISISITDNQPNTTVFFNSPDKEVAIAKTDDLLGNLAAYNNNASGSSDNVMKVVLLRQTNASSQDKALAKPISLDVNSITYNKISHKINVIATSQDPKQFDAIKSGNIGATTVFFGTNKDVLTGSGINTSTKPKTHVEKLFQQNTTNTTKSTDAKDSTKATISTVGTGCNYAQGKKLACH